MNPNSIHRVCKCAHRSCVRIRHLLKSRLLNILAAAAILFIGIVSMLVQCASSQPLSTSLDQHDDTIDSNGLTVKSVAARSTQVESDSNEMKTDTNELNERTLDSLLALLAIIHERQLEMQQPSSSQPVRRANFWKRANFWRKRANFW
jgi:hypothetical protein